MVIAIRFVVSTSGVCVELSKKGVVGDVVVIVLVVAVGNLVVGGGVLEGNLDAFVDDAVDVLLN